MQQVQTQKKANTRKTLYPFWFVIILGVLLTKHYHDIAVPTQNHDKEERTFAPPNHHSRKDLQKDVDGSDPLPDKDQQSLTVLGKSPFDKQQQQEAAQVNDSLLNKDKDKTKASGALSVHEVEQRFRDWLEENSKSTEIVPSDVIDDKGDIVVWIAKVISKMDIMESLLDVVEVTLRPISNNRRVSVYWKFFCFEEEAQRLIEAGLRNLKVGEGRTQVIFEPKKMKPYFWSRYLSPNSIPELVDYVWLLDGDISLRHMAWECFWTISHDQLKAKIFQPPLLFLDPAAEKSKTGWRQVVHQSSCQTNPASTMGSLVAIETGFIENQLPVFQRYAWELVYNSFGKKVRGWGNFGTSWGKSKAYKDQIDIEMC